jgi:hypothetical protein
MIERRIEAGPGTELAVSGRSGRVTVSGVDERAIRIRARGFDPRDFGGRDPLSVSQDGNRVRIAITPEADALDLDLEITAPRGCRLRVNTLEGDVSAHGLSAPIAVETVGGDVTVTQVREECSIQTVSGDITIGESTGSITVTTVDGDLNGHQLEGSLQATVTNGDVRLTGSQLGNMNLGAVNSDVTVETSLEPGGRYRASSTNGEIRLLVPAGAGATVHMKTQGGDIRADLPMREVISVDKRNWQGVLNGGGAEIYLESVNGDLRIRQSRAAGFDTVPTSPLVPPAPVIPPIPPIPPIWPSAPIEPDSPAVSDVSAPDSAATHETTVEILARLERGEISMEEAMARLDEL